MNKIIHTLFRDNPHLPEQIYAFCNQLPEFLEAERAYEKESEKLRTQLGPDQFDAFDEILTQYLAQYVHAYYLFGLGLRQEVLSALA